jgi:hypothetical protein
MRTGEDISLILQELIFNLGHEDPQWDETAVGQLSIASAISALANKLTDHATGTKIQEGAEFIICSQKQSAVAQLDKQIDELERDPGASSRMKRVLGRILDWEMKRIIADPCKVGSKDASQKNRQTIV